MRYRVLCFLLVLFSTFFETSTQRAGLAINKGIRLAPLAVQQEVLAVGRAKDLGTVGHRSQGDFSKGGIAVKNPQRPKIRISFMGWWNIEKISIWEQKSGYFSAKQLLQSFSEGHGLARFFPRKNARPGRPGSASHGRMMGTENLWEFHGSVTISRPKRYSYAATKTLQKINNN